MKKILSLLKPLSEFSAFLFPFVLVFYLILFLLENIFPGFVTNFFDINFFLIPVVIFGFLAVFANKDESSFAKATEEQEAKRGVFLLIAGLVTLSFVILIYKTADLGLTGFVISLISAILVGFISFIILVFPETEKTQEEIIETSKRELNIPAFNRTKYKYKKLFLSPIGLSLTGLIIIIITSSLVFSLYKGKVAEEKIIKNQQAINIIPQLKVEIPDKRLLSETPIFVENGSGKVGIAASTAAFLRDFNFGNVKTRDADNTTYKNAYIKFNREDLIVASYITFLLIDNDKYKIVNMIPPTNASQSGIILILGQ